MYTTAALMRQFFLSPQKQKAPNLVFCTCRSLYALLNPMLSFEILFYLFTDFFSSQLQMEDTISLYPFPNFQPSCFAPVVHLVMHNWQGLLNAVCPVNACQPCILWTALKFDIQKFYQENRSPPIQQCCIRTVKKLQKILSCTRYR